VADDLGDLVNDFGSDKTTSNAFEDGSGRAKTFVNNDLARTPRGELRFSALHVHIEL
jgi:hypothetical protein